MKLNDRKSTYFYHFPVDETDTVMADLAKAAEKNDAAAIKKCARLLTWLYEAFRGDPCGSDSPFDFDNCEFESVQQFNAAWKKEVVAKK